MTCPDNPGNLPRLKQSKAHANYLNVFIFNWLESFESANTGRYDTDRKIFRHHPERARHLPDASKRERYPHVDLPNRLPPPDRANIRVSNGSRPCENAVGGGFTARTDEATRASGEVAVHLGQELGALGLLNARPEHVEYANHCNVVRRGDSRDLALRRPEDPVPARKLHRRYAGFAFITRSPQSAIS